MRTETLAAALSEALGAPVELERPGDAAHGDFATNAALRLAPAGRLSPRALAAELAAAAALSQVERAEVAGPGFVNLLLAPGWFGGGPRRDPRGRRGVRRRFARAPRAGPGRAGLRQPDGADRRLDGAERRLRGLRRAPARVRRARRRARVLLQRCRDADGALPASVDALRRGEEPPEDGYHGAYIVDARAARRRPGSAHARSRSRPTPRALPHPLRQLGAAERARAAASRVPSAPRGLRARRRGLGPLDGVRRRQGPVLIRSTETAVRRRIARPTSRTSPTSSTAASTGRSTCSAPTTTARATGMPPSRGCSATTPTASRCCSTSSCT